MKRLAGFVCCLALLLTASLTATAADKHRAFTTKDGRQFITSTDGRRTIALEPPASAFTQPELPAGAFPIFDNFALAYPLGPYWTWQAWTISGPNSVLGFYAWPGMAFTPKVDATVTQIVIGAGWLDGTNQLTISLNADSGGLPGASLGSATVSGLQEEPNCCQIRTGGFDIPVSAGTQYWVVVQPSSSDSDTWGGWYLTSANETYLPFAEYSSGQWGAGTGVQGVFAVMGKKR
jgi:hypothetical protein